MCRNFLARTRVYIVGIEKAVASVSCFSAANNKFVRNISTFCKMESKKMKYYAKRKHF